jgi:hypothetical protein
VRERKGQKNYNTKGGKTGDDCRSITTSTTAGHTFELFSYDRSPVFVSASYAINCPDNGYF